MPYRHCRSLREEPGQKNQIVCVCVWSVEPLCADKRILPIFHSIFRHEIVLGENDASSDIDCDDDICADPLQYFKPTRIIVPKQYNKRRTQHDIALVKLDRPVCFTGVHTPGKDLQFFWRSDYIFRMGAAALHTIRRFNQYRFERSDRWSWSVSIHVQCISIIYICSIVFA